jgi:hypothetical protein
MARLAVWGHYLRLFPIILIFRLEESPDTVPSYINNVCIPETPSQFKGNRKENGSSISLVVGLVSPNDYTVKKVIVFSVPLRDVTNQTLLRRE